MGTTATAAPLSHESRDCDCGLRRQGRFREMDKRLNSWMVTPAVGTEARYDSTLKSIKKRSSCSDSKSQLSHRQKLTEALVLALGLGWSGGKSTELCKNITARMVHERLTYSSAARRDSSAIYCSRLQDVAQETEGKLSNS